MRLVPKEHSLSTCLLEGEDMSEFWEEGINDMCKITVGTCTYIAIMSVNKIAHILNQEYRNE